MENLKCIIYRKWDTEQNEYVDSEDQGIYKILAFIPFTLFSISRTRAILLDETTGLLKQEFFDNLIILTT